MPCQVLAAPLSEAEIGARQFYDRWIGESGLVSFMGRLIFRLSGAVYSGPFIRAARLTSDDRVLEIGCGLGTILTTAHKRICSTASYLGLDLSHQMVRRGRREIAEGFVEKRAELLVASALSLPVGDALFDVVLLSHVIKYLTDEQLSLVLSETKRVLKPGGRIVLWEFHPVATPSVTRLILHCCKAQKLRHSAELRAAMWASGFEAVSAFRIITPWLPWSNVAFMGTIV